MIEFDMNDTVCFLQYMSTKPAPRAVIDLHPGNTNRVHAVAIEVCMQQPRSTEPSPPGKSW